MISADDIEAFAESNREAIAAAVEFARRADKGLPQDRWASVRGMWLVAEGIKALMQLSAWQAEVIASVFETTAGEVNGESGI